MHLGNEPATWEAFRDAFLKQYSVLDEEQHARDRLKEARQTGRV